MSKKEVEAIKSFNGRYKFLSNFFPAKIVYEGVTYPTLEHAYQAAKTNNLTVRRAIRNCSTPGKAKKLGRKIKELKENWDKIKFEIMESLVLQKFSKNPDLKTALLNTGNAYLEEGNTWYDFTWGVCNGKGENHLGKILMAVRDKLKGKP